MERKNKALDSDISVQVLAFVEKAERFRIERQKFRKLKNKRG